MKVIGLEEHLVVPSVVNGWRELDPRWQDLAFAASTAGETGRRLAELGPDRFAAMDETGLDIQVISLTTPGVQNLDPAEAVVLQRETNDVIAAAVQAHPDRLQGLATLATPDPAAAAAELERAVTGLGLDGAMVFARTRDLPIADRSLWPIWEAAAALRAPIYLHPVSPVAAVRAAYYDGFDEVVSAAFATHRIGWHYETGVQLLRLIVSGVLDQFPDLQIIVGHWGEVVLFYLERLDALADFAKLPRKISDYVRDQVLVTPSGMLSERYLRWATEIVGTERIMFSTDYPFEAAAHSGARQFLATACPDDDARELIASGNWLRLRADIRR
jgi:predicted TIM-barrel fold metal-dependent hydrolase